MTALGSFHAQNVREPFTESFLEPSIAYDSYNPRSDLQHFRSRCRIEVKPQRCNFGGQLKAGCERTGYLDCVLTLTDYRKGFMNFEWAPVFCRNNVT